MSTREDLDDARTIFIGLLEVDPETANRIADVLERVYLRQALAQPREVVLQSAVWAAEQLQKRPIEELSRMGETQILSVLNTSDCPLCIGDAGSSSGSGGSPIATVPPRVPVFSPDVLRT